MATKGVSQILGPPRCLRKRISNLIPTVTQGYGLRMGVQTTNFILNRYLEARAPTLIVGTDFGAGLYIFKTKSVNNNFARSQM